MDIRPFNRKTIMLLSFPRPNRSLADVMCRAPPERTIVQSEILRTIDLPKRFEEIEFY